MSQAQIPAGQRRDAQALSQNKDYASVQEELEFWFINNRARYSDKNRRLLKVWHIVKIGLKHNDYLETHDTVNELIERFSDPFDYTPGFYSRIYYSHILTHDRLHSQKTYTSTSVQTDKEELVSSLSVATYLNIRKHLDELQRQQRLENQRSVGINTDLVEIDVNSQFDETAWLDPPKISAWADYETQSEPSLESVELAVLRDLYKTDNTSSDTEYVIAAEPTLESPPTLTETDTSQQPQRRKRRYQPDNEETPRRSLRIKTTHQSKQN